TWLDRFFPGSPWATPGGTFATTVSASTLVGDVGFYAFGPTAQLIQEVQTWVNASPSNFGWVLIGNESVQGARRFESREATDPTLRPVLHVDYTPGAAGVEPGAARVAFGMRRIEPNPVSRAARVSLTLANADAAELAVVDLQGRRLASRAVGSLGAGEH